MRVIKCEHCGKKVIDRSSTQNKRFCSKDCCTAHWYANEAQKPIEKPCKYNEGVWCEKSKCNKCGWNPEVAKKRMEKIYEKICSKPE